MRIGCTLRTPKKSLLSRDIHLPGPATHLACLELQPRFGVIEPAELVGSRIAAVSQQLGRIAEFLHDSDTGIVAEAEINAVEFIAAEVPIGIVRSRHRVELGRGLVACSNSPGRARIASILALVGILSGLPQKPRFCAKQ